MAATLRPPEVARRWSLLARALRGASIPEHRTHAVLVRSRVRGVPGGSAPEGAARCDGRGARSAHAGHLRIPRRLRACAAPRRGCRARERGRLRGDLPNGACAERRSDRAGDALAAMTVSVALLRMSLALAATGVVGWSILRLIGGGLTRMERAAWSIALGLLAQSAIFVGLRFRGRGRRREHPVRGRARRRSRASSFAGPARIVPRASWIRAIRAPSPCLRPWRPWPGPCFSYRPSPNRCGRRTTSRSGA